MINRLINAFITAIAILAFSSSAFAGCTKAQVSGTWEAVFSNGNSCKLRLNTRGGIVTGSSVCFDPDLGATAPDSGSLPVRKDCLAEGEIVVQGVVIELAIQFSADHGTGAGRYREPVSLAKGSLVMIRVP
jgi:hypothetical protein